MSGRFTVDTNILRIRDIFAINPQNSQFIQPGEIPTIGLNGQLRWYSSLEFLSSISVPTTSTNVLGLLLAVPQGLSTLSTAITTVTNDTIRSTVQGLGLVGYISSQQLVSTTSNLLFFTTSTIVSTTSNLQYQIQNLPGGGITYTQLASTTSGLGSSGYISSFAQIGASSIMASTITASSVTTRVAWADTINASSISTYSMTVYGENTLTVQGGFFTSSVYIQDATGGYANITVSDGVINVVNTNGTASVQLVTDEYLISSFAGLGTSGYISTASLRSSLQGLGNNYLSTAVLSNNLASTTAGLGSLGYISSLSLVSTTSNLILFTTSTIVSTTSNLLYQIQQLSGGGVTYTQLASTTAGLGTTGYLSTISGFASTVAGLGTAGYLSTAVLSNNLASTTAGLGSLGYVSTATDVTSSIRGLGLVGYISTASLTSSLQGLGNNYLSTAVLSNNLASTTAGLGSLGYVSTATDVTSSIRGLGLVGYISTASLTSSLQGLGNNYLSTAVLSNNLASTTAGLGSLGYVSSTQLFSTTNNIVASNLPSTVAGLSNFLGQRYVSSLSNVLSLSTQQIQTSSLSSFYINAGTVNFANILSNGSAYVPGGGGWLGATSTAIVIGYQAGFFYQGEGSVVIGSNAGYSNNSAGVYNNSNYIAIGRSAGYSNQSTNSIAIGYLAGSNTTAQSSIILNALGSVLNSSNAGLYVKPVRGNLNLNTSLSTNANNPLVYNIVTGEISYASSLTVSSLFANGDIYAVGNVTAFSDRRLKENIVTILNPLSTLNNLRGVSYTRNDLPNSTLKYIGVIAQEVEAVLPEVVFTLNDERETKSVSYGNMVALLIESVKEQESKSVSYGNMVALLIESVKEQESKISSLTYFYDTQTYNLSSLTSSYNLQTCKMSSLTSSYELLTQQVSTLIGSQRDV